MIFRKNLKEGKYIFVFGRPGLNPLKQVNDF